MFSTCAIHNFIKHIVLILLLYSSGLWSQEVSPSIQELRNNLNRLNNETKLDSIGYLIEKQLDKNDLSGFELQLVLFFQGNYYNQIGRTSDAIMALQKSIIQKVEGKEADRIYYKSLYILSDLNFTKKEYKKAFYYASLCKDKIPVTQNRANEYMGLHLIIGYYYYINYDHKKSMQEFLLAEQAAKKYDPCKLSEVYVKTARIYSRKDQLDKAKKAITESARIADSCDALENKINAMRTLREILVEHGEFEAAHKTFERLDRLVGLEDTKRRNIRIDSFEVANRIKLKDQQNITLKRINESTEIKLQKQKIALIAALIGITLLIILLYSIFVLTRKQRETNETLKLQKEQIENKNSELKRLNLLHQKIFTVISHDFKEPITTLKVLLDKEEIANNESKVVSSYIKAISQQLEQSDTMLTSLLEWARAELITTISNTSEIKLFDFITAARRELSHQLKAKNIQIDNRISKETIIIFNPTVLSIVLRNIINNAIKFSYENSSIIIEYENNEIIIKDFGKGIEQKKIDKLFRKSINPGVGTNFESGFGIGLYLCQELMLKNGGTLDVFNNEPQGCVFKIILPT
ncbi:sensor histidine kinase [Flavobacterium chilense]|uniref:histidine kinase n=1 Tax=Flavobacterium chilense TaxID=946677 RepID=A0A1M7GC80_9FLAO|nr:HAMP domain-containing sensor histidine kinase [Flavobacterium chilense]SHM13994.1 Signal transduction histidine kinase [Flavobacterium chilense]